MMSPRNFFPRKQEIHISCTEIRFHYFGNRHEKFPQFCNFLLGYITILNPEVSFSIFNSILPFTEAVTGNVLLKEVFLKISELSQESTCVRAQRLKKKLLHWCFPVNFVKFLRSLFLKNTARNLLFLFTCVYYLNPSRPEHF